ncbi:MAG: phage portal protein [Phycisphaerae bacterium]|jgi:capsid protein
MWFFGKNKERKVIRPAGRIMRARFDAAQTTADNQRHWSNADSLSADGAASVEVRRTLRNRSRYEVANNSYAKGIISTLANDVVGTGPRLQMLTDDNNGNGIIETEFMNWASQIRLAQKLRTMRMARASDGEAFGILTINRNLNSPVKLDLRLVEADQVTTPWSKYFNQQSLVDGIEFDLFGNPSAYYVLKNHPGSMSLTFDQEYNAVDADSMVHWFRAERPGQSRGIPEITPAFPLFAQLRRYTLAVIAAAETAADFAAVLYTDSPANGEAANLEPMDVVALEKRMATTLPDGWKLGQIEAHQPTTTYGEFKNQILNEIARCLNMPFNIAACNSSGYNYASGRLDHQTYYKSIRVDQADMAMVILDRILQAWLNEAILISDYLPLHWRTMRRFSHQWFWDGTEHVDPAKEAKAQEIRLANHTTTLADEYAKQGKDWEVELRQRAREKQLMDELGISPEKITTSITETDDEEQ